MLKKLILILMPLALALGQQRKAPKKKHTTDPQQSSVTQPAAVTQAPAAAQPVPAAAPPASNNAEALKIPPGAKEVEPYLFAFTDAQGKKWFYRQTPFGVVRWEDKPVVAAPIADNTNPVVINDLGDSIRFSWKTPFGVQTWVRKKTELTDDEKAMIQREQDKRSSPDPLAGARTTDATRKTSEKQ